MKNTEQERDSYLEDFRTLSNVLFALCMFSSVLKIHVPDTSTSASDLVALIDQNIESIANFAVAFIFLAMYWVKFIGKLHHTKRTNSKIMALWLIYLATLCLYPFAESLLGSFPGSVVAQVIFSSLWALIGFIGLLSWAYAYWAKLLDDNMSENEAKRLLYESCPEPVFALLSIPMAFVSDVAYYFALFLIIPANFFILRRISKADI